MTDQESSEEPCWVAFLDVYGFAARLRGRSPLGELAETLRAMHSAAGVSERQTKTYFFSDSIIMVQPAGDDARSAFKELEALVRNLSSQALKHALILRGAFSFGPMLTDTNICIGLPLLQAYQLEQKLYLPIVVIPEKALKEADIHTLNIMYRDIPLKQGIISAMVILPAPNHELMRHAVEAYQKTRIDGPPEVASVWKETIEFIEKVDDQRNEEEQPEVDNPENS